MNTNKKIWLTLIFLFQLTSVARSETTSTQQITPTSCTGYFVPASSTETESTITSLTPVITPDPTTEVITHQPVSQSPPANPIMNPMRERRLTDCALATCNCLTQEQAWPQLRNMYAEHSTILGLMTCFPLCWPPLLGMLLYGEFCNPPFPEGVTELPACCQPQPAFEFPQTTLGQLAGILSQYFNRGIRYSDALVLWINRLLGTGETRHLECYNPIAGPPSSSLPVAVVHGINSVVQLPLVSAIQLDTSLQQINQHLIPFTSIPAEQVDHSFTDIVTIFIFPLANNQLIAIHQSNSSTAWMIIPQLQTSEGRPAESRLDFIRTHLDEIAGQDRTSDQPVIIIRLFIQRPANSD